MLSNNQRPKKLTGGIRLGQNRGLAMVSEACKVVFNSKLKPEKREG